MHNSMSIEKLRISIFLHILLISSHNHEFGKLHSWNQTVAKLHKQLQKNLKWSTKEK